MTYYTEAQKRASRKYNEKNYDRLYITIAKGRKEQIKEKAEESEMSLNEYVVNLIENDLKGRD